MEITKREILFSIIIIVIMLTFGLFIGRAIDNHIMDGYQKYDTALQIQDNSESFQYGMRTDVGNAFIYSTLEAVDTVTYPEIKKGYMQITKQKQRYTKHTKVERIRRRYHIKVYYTWDTINTESKICKEVKFCGVIFDSNQIPLPPFSYLTTIQESSKIRYRYYVVDQQILGTLFAELKDNTINGDIRFFDNHTIEESIESLESKMILIIFWIIWLIFIVIVTYAFYYIDNQWLEG